MGGHNEHPPRPQEDPIRAMLEVYVANSRHFNFGAKPEEFRLDPANPAIPVPVDGGKYFPANPSSLFTFQAAYFRGYCGLPDELKASSTLFYPSHAL